MLLIYGQHLSVLNTLSLKIVQPFGGPSTEVHVVGRRRPELCLIYEGRRRSAGKHEPTLADVACCLPTRSSLKLKRKYVCFAYLAPRSGSTVFLDMFSKNIF